VEVAADVNQDFLLGDVVDADAEAVEQFAQKLEAENCAGTGDEERDGGVRGLRGGAGGVTGTAGGG